MAETEKPLDIHAYIGMALRRKWYIIIPLILSVVGSFAVFKKLPKLYRATTMILVQPQSVPRDFVRSTVTDPVTSRLDTLSQEILSRTRLEKVIHEFDLYGDLRSRLPMEEVVERMRNVIEVKLQRRPNPYDRNQQNTFSISFNGREPRPVMLVTNKLASLFIEENLKVRGQQAEKTSEFLSEELQSMEDKLKKKEMEIRAFKERAMGQLPTQLDANLRILERLQQQLQTTSESIRAAEDRAIVLQNQIEALTERGRMLTSGHSVGETSPSMVQDPGAGQVTEDPVVTQWNQLKNNLAAAQAKYTENHPDVVDLKKRIAKLEPRVKEALENQANEREARLRAIREQRDSGSALDPSLAVLDPASERLLAQYTEQRNGAQLEAKRLKGEEASLKEQVALYQRRIEGTPRNEQELAFLTRDYDVVKLSYQSLLDKKMQAQMAENLEGNQQGEQFRILDEARVPEKPIKPDRNKILLMGLFLGLALGVGLAWFRESLDQSFHTVAEVESQLELPVLATIPNLKEEEKKAA